MKSNVIWTLVLVAVVAFLTVGVAAVWLTTDVSGLGLVFLVAGLSAAGLVGYFRWRINLRRRIVAEPYEYREAA
jgi:hypothetical protein